MSWQKLVCEHAVSHVNFPAISTLVDVAAYSEPVSIPMQSRLVPELELHTLATVEAWQKPGVAAMSVDVRLLTVQEPMVEMDSIVAAVALSASLQAEFASGS